MAVFHGKYGAVDFSTAGIFKVDNWGLVYGVDTVDTTGMSETATPTVPWRTHLVGLEDYSATCEGLSGTALDLPALIGVDAALKLFVDGTHSFSGTGICIGLSESVDINGQGKVTYSFQRNSTALLTYATGAFTAPAGLTPFHGKLCHATHTAAEFTNVTGWSSTLSCDTADSTVYSATLLGRTRVGGFAGGTCSVTCLVAGDVQTICAPGTSYALILYRTVADKGWTGTGYCTGFDVKLGREGIAEVTFNFIWTGAVTKGT